MSREPGRLQLSALIPSDRPAVAALLHTGSHFSVDEAAVALELFDLGVGRGTELPEDASYRWRGVRDAGVLLGVACYGETPATDGTWDLYWIVVAEEARGRGVGTALLRGVEAEVVEAGGRLLVIETSSRDDYAGTRAFYERSGYALCATLSGFYAEGDDRLIFARRPGSPLANRVPAS